MVTWLTQRGRWGAKRRAPMLIAVAVSFAWVLPSATQASATSLGLADGAMAFIVPTVQSVKPDDGPAAGGTHVTVAGTGFKGATEVHFGSASASFTESGAGHIKATAPAGTGTVDVTVTTPGGTSAINPSDQFSYVPPEPIVEKVSPSSGREKGAMKITIKGTGFAGATEVHFGSVTVKHLTVKGEGTEIGVVDPSLAVVRKSTVDVTVTTPLGTSAVTPADQFSYRVLPPIVGKIKPKEGKAAGGEAVHIGGANFVEVTAVSFGSVNASEFTVSSLGLITAIAPAETVGVVQITVTTPFGTSQPGVCTIHGESAPCPPFDTFKFVEPTITNMTPNTGSTAGGTMMSVTGTGFGLGTSATTFEFDKTPAASVDCVSMTTCDVVTPAHGAGAVTVTAIVHAPGIERDKTSGTPADRFTYE
jgi:hypothetical protein